LFVIESLSSFRTHPKDEEKFIRTVDNYIKHSKKKKAGGAGGGGGRKKNNF